MRFRRTRTRRPRRLRWLEGISQTVSGTGTYQQFVLSNPALASAGPLTEILSQSQIQNELDGNGTLMRIVGQMHVSLPWDACNAGNFGTEPVVIWLGIKANEVPPAGNVTTWDISGADAQDASWLFMKTVTLMGSARAFPNELGESPSAIQFGGCCWSTTVDIDVKARRKLRQDMAVSLYGQGATGGGSAFGSSVGGVLTCVHLIGNLRVLCKLS